ncbi:uncharacterized protein EI90DRAFT_2993553 [Cantharellus anzutake]|uniref:uncharacterized protein n=1 Tax=Cantharellus anzutake TaxID=1750568 RepID=UPI001907AB6D|nr:uncharacterized protein EI90DRAFT_2993553 [Cantharellus anzutake]KAF8334646.1 hypothetical protein EI90DRAFT_2993553 [Cantharellus anzutake]
MESPSQTDPKVFYVCVTGYGPFSHYARNPAWLSTAPLNGKVLRKFEARLDTQSIDPVPSTGQSLLSEIHIVSFELRVSYQHVLSVIEPLHATPPELPDSVALPDSLPPQHRPFDLILHVGVGPAGGMRIEAMARRFGYREPDIDNELAPPVHPSHLSVQPPPLTMPMTTTRPLRPYVGIIPKPIAMLRFRDDVSPPRGFGQGYEGCPDEIWNPSIDVQQLVQDVHQCGIQDITHSSDAGLYLCEFVYYCSLAQHHRIGRRVTSHAAFPISATETEASSTANGQDQEVSSSASRQEELPPGVLGTPDRCPKVLFVHVPPVGEPQTLEDMTFAIENIIKVICWGAGDAAGVRVDE